MLQVLSKICSKTPAMAPSRPPSLKTRNPYLYGRWNSNIIIFEFLKFLQLNLPIRTLQVRNNPPQPNANHKPRSTAIARRPFRVQCTNCGRANVLIIYRLCSESTSLVTLIEVVFTVFSVQTQCLFGYAT